MLCDLIYDASTLLWGNIITCKMYTYSFIIIIIPVQTAKTQVECNFISLTKILCWHRHISPHFLANICTSPSTLVQHCTNVLQMFCVCWDVTIWVSHSYKPYLSPYGHKLISNIILYSMLEYCNINSHSLTGNSIFPGSAVLFITVLRCHAKIKYSTHIVYRSPNTTICLCRAVLNEGDETFRWFIDVRRVMLMFAQYINDSLNPLTAGVAYIRVFFFLLAH